MRDKIINNILIKMGSRIRKNDLEFLGQVLVEELRDVQIKKETTELAEYNDSMRKLKDMFLATLLIENKSKRTIEQYNLHLTQFAEFFTYKEVKDIGKYLAVFLGVIVFILCGFEHCIANMYYFSVSSTWSLNTLLYLLVMILGNSLGGILIPLCNKVIKKG